MLVFEGIESQRRYRYRGREMRFYFRASKTKKTGSMRSGQAKASLHFELPRSVRFDKTKRAAMIKVLTALVAQAWGGRAKSKRASY